MHFPEIYSFNELVNNGLCLRIWLCFKPARKKKMNPERAANRLIIKQTFFLL